MSLLALYAVTALVFLALDAVWLKAVAMPLFRRTVGLLMLAEPRLGVAAGFYALYCVGIVYFAAAPAQGAVGSAFVNGALFGFFAYGTYEATNLSTLKGWTPRLAAIDTAWGSALTGTAAAAAAAVVG